MLLPGWLGAELERVQHLPAGHRQPGEQSQGCIWENTGVQCSISAALNVVGLLIKHTIFISQQRVKGQGSQPV